MCLYCVQPFASNAAAQDGVTKRDMLRRAAVVGTALPFAFSASKDALTAEQSGLPPEGFKEGVKDLVARAHSSELAAYRLLEINGADLPWMDLGLEATKGQQITFLLTGRMWIARQFDLWFAPGLVFHARTRR